MYSCREKQKGTFFRAESNLEPEEEKKGRSVSHAGLQSGASAAAVVVLPPPPSLFPPPPWVNTDKGPFSHDCKVPPSFFMTQEPAQGKNTELCHLILVIMAAE